MARFRVVFSHRAKKDLNGLSDNEFDRIIDGCKRLEDNPVPDGKHVKNLRGYKDLFRFETREPRGRIIYGP